MFLESADTEELFSTIVAPLIIGSLPGDHVAVPFVQRQLGHIPDRITSLARKIVWKLPSCVSPILRSRTSIM